MAELLLSPVTQHQIVSVTTVLTLRLRWLVTDSGSGGHHHHPDPHAINWNPSRPSLPQSIKIIFWDVSHCFVSWWIVKSTKPLIDESLPNVCKRRYKCLFHRLKTNKCWLNLNQTNFSSGFILSNFSFLHFGAWFSIRQTFSKVNYWIKSEL